MRRRSLTEQQSLKGHTVNRGAGMEDNFKVCKNCAFGAVRTDTKRFPWCKYICTLEVEDNSRHIAYKYEDCTCEHFCPTDKPTGFLSD